MRLTRAVFSCPKFPAFRKASTVEPFVEPVYVETRRSYGGKDVFMLRLNRPFKQNAINTFMVEHLIVALKVFQNSSTSDAAILYAKGDDFSLGYDLWHFDKLFCNTEALIDSLKIKKIKSSKCPTSKACQKPIVTAIHGRCANGGLELAMNSDSIIASDDAVFSLLQYQIGLPLIDDGPQRIAEIIGVDKTIEMIQKGTEFSAKDAKELNLINQVVSKDELQEAAFDAASEIAKNNGPFNESSVFRTVYAELEKNDALELVIDQSSDLFKIRKIAERVAF